MQENRIFAVMDGVRRGISVVSGFTGAALIFLMTMLIMIDVFLRIFAGVTTYVATEWAGYMLVGIGFLGLAYTQKRRKHIQIEMVTSRLPESIRKKLEVVVLIVGVFFIGWLAASTMEPVLQSYRIHRLSINVIQTPMWIPSLMVPAGLGMLCIELVIELAEAIRGKPVGS